MAPSRAPLEVVPAATLAAAAATLAAQSARAAQRARDDSEEPTSPHAAIASGSSPHDGAQRSDAGHDGAHRRDAGRLAAAGTAVVALAAVLTLASLHYDHARNPVSAAASSAAGHHQARGRSAAPSTTKVATRGRSGGPGKAQPNTQHRPGAGSKPGTKGDTAQPSTAKATTNPKAASSPAINLAVPAGFGPSLRRAWVAADPGRSGLSAADVQSTLGSVFYAEQPSIRTYWAMSSFAPSARAESLAGTAGGKVLLAQFGTVAVFDKAPGHGWAFVGSAAKGACAAAVPGPVFVAWGICATDPSPTTTGS